MLSQTQSLSERGKLFPQQLTFMIGLICITGFAIDILVIGLPPNPGNSQWRLNFLQQVAERGLLLFLGAILLLHSQLEHSTKRLRLQSVAYLTLGLFVSLSSFLVVVDNFDLQREAITNIDIQAAALRTRIVESRDNPEPGQEITAKEFSIALRQVEQQADEIKQDIRTGAIKTLISASAKLLLIGLGLVALGRLGLINSLTKRRKRQSSSYGTV